MNEIARLRCELEEARERISQLEEALHPSGLAPTDWGLTPSQSRMFSALAAREFVTREALTLCCFGWSDSDPDIRKMHVQMVRLRKGIAPYGYRIETIRWQGYRLVRPQKVLAA